MSRAVRSVVCLLVCGAGFALAGCQRGGVENRRVASVPEPVEADLYSPAVTTREQSDPFAQPGVFNAPVDDGGGNAVFTTPTTGGGTYQVQKGDTLWSISTKVYGDGQKWREIAAANPDLKDANAIREGQVINLP